MTLTAILAAALLSATPAQPQTAPTTPAAQAASPGLAISDMTAFLAAQGVTVGPVQQDSERRFVSVTDGPLRWVVFFQSCEGESCSDLQFSLAFADAGVTLEGVNRWNRERRFLKAFYEPAVPPATAPAAAVQYDVFLHTGQGVGQLADPVAIWRGSIPQFAGAVAGALPAAGTPVE